MEIRPNPTGNWQDDEENEGIFVMLQSGRCGKIYMGRFTCVESAGAGLKSKRGGTLPLRNQEKVTETENPVIRYRACEEWHTDPVLGRYCSYGILCEQLLSGDGWLQLQAVSDVTDSAVQAKALAAMMQQGELDPCQLLEVVEDYLIGGGVL